MNFPVCGHSKLLPLPDIVERALHTAAFAHRRQMRKGMNLPYIVHPFAVGMMLHGAECSEEVIAAGLLHDVPEDTEIGLPALRVEFGDHVALIVSYCTEEKTKDWEERKLRAIENFRHAPLAVKFVAAADKLDNLRSIVAEHEKVGAQVWARFNRGRDKQAWFYRSVTQSILENLPEGTARGLFALLEQEVKNFFG